MSLSPCKSMSISELISELRDSFLSRDFERVEQVLVEREAKLRAELEEKKRENGCLKEKIFFERLAKINAELTLKSLMEKGLVKSDDNSNEFGLGGGGGIIVKSEKCMVEVENGKVGFLEEKEIGFGGGLEGKEVVAGIISNDGGIGAAALGELEIKNVINIEDGDEDEFNSQVSLDKKEAKNSCTIGINNDHKSSSSGAHQKNLLTGLAEGIGNLKRKFISSRELNANINVLDGLVSDTSSSSSSSSSDPFEMDLRASNKKLKANATSLGL